jgi:TolB-like protein/DNA-binding winged helix-turn-helix (wHTH) protein/Tfp pilus assembly protein PilF
MAGREPRLVRFGNFELDQRTGELRKHGLKIKLQQKPFQVLSILMEHRGVVVSREELQRRLWPEGVFVDFDHSLNTAIKKLRDALGDTAAAPRYIATIDRHGYRFTGPVEDVSSTEQPVTPNNATEISPALGPITAPSTPTPPIAPDHRRWWAGAAIVLATFTGVLSWPSLRPHLRPRASTGKMMLAVLPFENLTGDTGQDYFSDGLTEEMITHLGRLDPQRLGVIARTSVMRYKQNREPLDRISRELGVQYVLEGSVRRDAEQVRITAKLIRAADDTHVWAKQYDRELSNLLALQGEIAQEVAGEIQLTLGDNNRVASAPQPTLSAEAYEAYDLYLKGRYFWNKRTSQGFEQAIKSFQQAIAKDPKYARAYAGLADSYAMMSDYALRPAEELMPKARAAAVRALEIDEGLAEAHASLAVIVQNYDWDWQTSEKEYQRAVQLDPNYATAHHWYAESLAFQGRFEEALAESERARRLDPVSPIIAADNGAILYFSRQFDRAIAQFRAVNEIEPNFPRAHVVIYAYVQKRLFADALGDIEKWRRADDTPWTWASEAYVYGRLGQPAQAHHALKRFDQANENRRVDPAPLLAMAYAGMDNKDDALAWLQKAYVEHCSVLTALKVDPIYDPLRRDPRFQQLLRRVRLDQ